MATTTQRPMLESGDRLTRDEFHRRYSERPDIRRAELVQGVVYVPSPTRYGAHDSKQLLVINWLSAYSMRHPGVKVTGGATVLLSTETEVQPDASLFRDPPPSGGARVNEDDYVEGPPQLVVEVAASSASYDLHDKLRAYESAGVLEYVVWRTLEAAIDWFRLQDGRFVRVQPNERGVIESTAFPGLRLHVAKMLAGDIAGVLAELDARTG